MLSIRKFMIISFFKFIRLINYFLFSIDLIYRNSSPSSNTVVSQPKPVTVIKPITPVYKTVKPITQVPTVVPTVHQPTVKPTFHVPSIVPTVQQPSVKPTFQEPTFAPAVHQPPSSYHTTRVSSYKKINTIPFM